MPEPRPVRARLIAVIVITIARLLWIMRFGTSHDGCDRTRTIFRRNHWLVNPNNDRTTKSSLRSTRKSRFVRRQRTLIFSSAQRLDRSGWDELFWRYATYRDIRGSLSDLTNLDALGLTLSGLCWLDCVALPVDTFSSLLRGVR